MRSPSGGRSGHEFGMTGELTQVWEHDNNPGRQKMFIPVNPDGEVVLEFPVFLVLAFC
jgi:hypothetical protein